MTVVDQHTVTYTYDNVNRLTQITQGTSTVTFTYDAAGRRTSVTLPNGVAQDYTYDAASRLISIEYWNGTTLLGNLTYTYDAAGNRTKIGGSYARTGLPQPLSSAIYNAANQQTAWAGTTLTYDANGNLTNDGSNNYIWDARNRLASMTGVSFAYDALGRRTNKTVSGISTGFLYDGQNPVQELSGATPTANLLTGLGIDQFLTRTDSAGTRSLLTDALGSTLALTDTAGTVQTEYSYEPFGQTTTTGTANSNSFQYTDREYDGTGVLYYRARYYNPTLQRFISEDPLGVMVVPSLRISAGHSYYYAENNPMRFTDPTGLAVWVCNRKTDWGVGNHAYLWDGRRSCSMRGSFGSGDNSSPNDIGPPGNQCNLVQNSTGMEDLIFSCCQKFANWGPWVPPISDCHTLVRDCLEAGGLKNPGAPGGRLGKPCDACDSQ